MNGKVRFEKRKIRFTFIDLLVLALALLLIIGVVGINASKQAEQKELILTFGISAHDVLQAQAGQSLPQAQSEVTAAESTALYGVLEEDYKAGNDRVILRVTAKMEGSDPTVAGVRLYIGQKLDLRCGELLCHGAVLENITEVKEIDRE